MKKIIIGGIVLFAAIVGIVLFVLLGNSKSIDDYLDLGAKYLEAQDYDKAIEAYTEALKIDDMSVEAYLGLADAYVGKGDIDKAIEILETGYEKTRDDRLQEKIKELSIEKEAKFYENIETFPITEEGKELVSLLIRADGITIDGHSYTTKDLVQMNGDEIANILDCTIEHDDVVDYDYYVLPEKYQDNCVLMIDDGGYDLYFFSRADNWDTMLYSVPVLYSNLDDYGYEYMTTHLYCNGQTYAPDYLNSKDLFLFLNSYSIDNVNELAQFLCGESLQSGKKLIINAELMICYYDYQSYPEESIEVEGVDGGYGDIDIMNYTDGGLLMFFYSTNMYTTLVKEGFN